MRRALRPRGDLPGDSKLVTPHVRNTAIRPSLVLGTATLGILWLFDWHVAHINFGPLAAVPIFFMAHRLSRAGACALVAFCAAGFALVDADMFANGQSGVEVALSALALASAFAFAAWSSRRFYAYRRSLEGLQHALSRREAIAAVDYVTGIHNRTHFEELLSARLSRTDGRRFAVVFADLDGFKRVNDRHGHLAGDDILRQVADRFVTALGHRGEVARIGGDEFALIVDGAATARDAVAIERELHAALMAPFALGAEQLAIAASFGSSIFPDDGSTRAELLGASDSRMYSAKHAYRAERCHPHGNPDAPGAVTAESIPMVTIETS